MPRPTSAELEQMARRLADDGKLVEAGWIGFRLSAIPPQASDAQLVAMRQAFMAGAHHLFFAILNAVDDGDEPSAADLARMDKVAAELTGFIDNELKGRA